MSAPDYPRLLMEAEKKIAELNARIDELEGLITTGELVIAAVAAAKRSRVTTGSSNL